MLSKAYFYQLLSRRDYSVAELLYKGKQKGYPEEEMQAAIEQLQEMGYQSDTRLAETIITGGQGKYGKSVLKRKCLTKGISAEVFDQIWDGQHLEEPEDAIADLKDKIIRKYKIDNFEHLDASTYRKVCQYLQYRGFNPMQLLAQWRTASEE